jgi:hypothetical protein
MHICGLTISYRNNVLRNDKQSTIQQVICLSSIVRDASHCSESACQVQGLQNVLSFFGRHSYVYEYFFKVSRELHLTRDNNSVLLTKFGGSIPRSLTIGQYIDFIEKLLSSWPLDRGLLYGLAPMSERSTFRVELTSWGRPRKGRENEGLFYTSSPNEERPSESEPANETLFLGE